ncbi:hypothetical protein [Terribacillus saccharophilus]|uniref:hypothetical protein n=1 Tax=Terribacillus saccharophilus TaxID=361277 RepID=UPI002989F458|nr:hypothetical protein [Terribacillus saccharophilus]MCM3227496.1 hypothetical protein [Terribacillus saccharophilus]
MTTTTTVLSMADKYRLTGNLISELDDAIELMKSLFVDEDLEKRIKECESLLAETQSLILQMKEEYKTTWLLGDSDDSYRICSECDEVMSQGYCIDGGTDYYCTDYCLHKNHTPEEYKEMHCDGEGDSYWTEWGE